MKLTQELGSGSYRIRSFQPGQVRVNNELIEHNVVVTPDALIRDWPPGAVGDLGEGDFDAIVALKPEVIILGTGERQRFPEQSLMRALLRKGIGIEVMNTAAACRTYNVLMAEDRRVAAALLLR